MSLAPGSKNKLRDYYGVPEQAIPHSQVACSDPVVPDASNKTTAEFGTGENCEIELPTYQQAVVSENAGTESKPGGHLSKWGWLYYICALGLILGAVVVCGLVWFVTRLLRLPPDVVKLQMVQGD